MKCQQNHRLDLQQLRTLTMKFVYLPYDEAPKFEDFSGLR